MSNFEKITNAARDFACGIYRAYPGDLVSNPVQDVRRLIWDSLCGENPSPNAPPLPSPPAPPFSGGQCDAIGYRVSVRGVGGGLGNNPVDNYVDVFGPITRIALVTPIAGVVRVEVTCRGAYPNSLSAPGQKLSALQWGSTPSPPAPSFTILSIVRLGGGADNCGNPPSTFPPAPPRPPGGYTSPATPITINDGTTTNYYFNFTPPALPSPANFLPPVIINFIRPEISPDFNIPISFNFDGTINFGGGGGGGGSGEFNQDDRDTLNTINNTTNNLGDEVTNIQNEINNITNNYNNKPPNPDDFEPPSEPTAPGERTKSFLAAVEITLGEIPINAKVQSGDGAPNVIYAGWFEWKRAGKFTPREPIHFEKSVFLAPPGIDGYAWTLYDGFTGTAVEIVNKEKT